MIHFVSRRRFTSFFGILLCTALNASSAFSDGTPVFPDVPPIDTSAIPIDLVQAFDLYGYDLQATYREIELLRYVVFSDEPYLASWLIRFPMSLNTDSQSLDIIDVDEFYRKWRTIRAILRPALKDFDFSTLFLNGEGIMIGDGVVWLGPNCDAEGCDQSSIRVFAINDSQ